MPVDRFFPRFALEFEGLEAADGFVAEAVRAVASAVPVNRDYYEADVKVSMRYALTGGNTFEITIAGLPTSLYNAIKAGQTVVTIKLGYYLDEEAVVLEGVVQKKETEAGDCFYETKLKGVDKAYYLLQKTCLWDEDEESGQFHFQEGDALREILATIGDAVEGVERPSPSNIAGDGQDVLIERDWSFHGRTALGALQDIQNLLQRVNRQRDANHYALLLRDGQIWYDRAGAEQNNAGVMREPTYSYDNYLADTNAVSQQRGGRSSRCRAPSQGDNGDSASGRSRPSPIGYGYVLLGDPALRPGDSVDFKVKLNGQEKTEHLTIESITHDYSRKRGYRCTGRALQREGFARHVLGAMAPGPATVGEEVNNVLARNQERHPAVNIGDITEYIAREHTAHARLGLDFEPTMTSPSIQVRRDAEGFTLERRPLVSPFAWNLCGLIVPVYAGMRAVAVHNRYLREDALLSGFLWTEEMELPPSQAGDYWLCLPLDVPDDRPPNDSDKAANDLTTGDGKRVIQLKGLRITVGEGLLPDLGTRPTNLGADDELQIEHSSGAKITMKANEIKLEAGGRTVDISGGKVNIT